MDASPLTTHALFHLGIVPVSGEVVTTWGIMAVLAGTAWLGTRRATVHAGPLQSALEVTVETVRRQIEEIVRIDARPFVPLLGTLFLFLVCANLTPLLPGAQPPTAHVETPAALAAVVFVSVHVFGIRARGPGRYLGHYLKPTWLLLPLNLLTELTRTFSIAIRLFGNMMSHEFVLAILLSLSGLFLPIPFMALGVLIGLIQAYIFTVLSAVYIGAAIGRGSEG